MKVNKIIWGRANHLLLPETAFQVKETLFIFNSTFKDSGWYVCTAILYDDIELISIAPVTIQSRFQMTVISRNQKKYTIAENSNKTFQCDVGIKTTNIKWMKNRESDLRNNILIKDNILSIIRATVENNGFYTCQVTQNQKVYQKLLAFIEVERKFMKHGNHYLRIV